MDTLDTTQDGNITRNTFIANAKMILFHQDPSSPSGEAYSDDDVGGGGAGQVDYDNVDYDGGDSKHGNRKTSTRRRFAAARGSSGGSRGSSGGGSGSVGKADTSSSRGVSTKTKKGRKSSLSESRVFHLQELFTAADHDGHGSIGQTDFAVLVQDEAVAGGAKLSAPFVQELFKSIDTDADGQVDFDEVVAAFEAVDGVTGKSDNAGDGAKVSLRAGHRTEAAEAMADRLGHEVEEQRVARASEHAISKRNQRQLEDYFEDSQAEYEQTMDKMAAREHDLLAKVKALEVELSEAGTREEHLEGQVKKISAKLADADVKIKAFKPADTSQHFKDLMQLDARIAELERENDTLLTENAASDAALRHAKRQLIAAVEQSQGAEVNLLSAQKSDQARIRVLEQELDQLHYDAQKTTVELESERRVVVRLEMDLEKVAARAMADEAQKEANAAASTPNDADGGSPENEKLLQEAADITESTHALLMHMQQQLDEAVAEKVLAVASCEEAQAALAQEQMTSRADVIAVGAELDEAKASLEVARRESLGGIQQLSTQMQEMTGSLASLGEKEGAKEASSDGWDVIDGDDGEHYPAAGEKGARRKSKLNVTELGAGLDAPSTALAKSSTALAKASNENIRLKKEAVLAKAQRDRLLAEKKQTAEDLAVAKETIEKGFAIADLETVVAALTEERDAIKTELAELRSRVEAAFQKASDDSLTAMANATTRSMLASLRHELRESGEYAVVDASATSVDGENDPMMLALVVLEERIELRAAIKRLWETKSALDTATNALTKTRGDVSILESEAVANASMVDANESLLVEQTRQAIMSARALLEHALSEERAETDNMIQRVRSAVETAVREERGETSRVVARVRDAISSALVTERSVMNGLLAKSKNMNEQTAGKPIFSPATRRPAPRGIQASSTPRQQQRVVSESRRSPGTFKPERLFSRGAHDEDNNDTTGSFRADRIFSRNAESAVPPELDGLREDGGDGDDDVFAAVVPAPPTTQPSQGSAGDENGWVPDEALTPFPNGADTQRIDDLPNAVFMGQAASVRMGTAGMNDAARGTVHVGTLGNRVSTHRADRQSGNALDLDLPEGTGYESGNVAIYDSATRSNADQKASTVSNRLTLLETHI